MKVKLTKSLEPHLDGCRVSFSRSRENSTLCPTVEGQHDEYQADRVCTHLYSGSSESKSTHSTPTSSKVSSTMDARNWSIPSSIPRKSEGPVLDIAGIGIYYSRRYLVECYSSRWVMLSKS